MKAKYLCLVFIINASALIAAKAANIVTYAFTDAPYLNATSVDLNLSSTNMALSSGTIETNITTGSYFPNEPYIEESSWTATTQATAKAFTFTITATSGYTFSISSISLNAYTTSAGPTGVGISVNGTSILTQSSTDSSLFQMSQSISLTGLTTAVISIQGWLDGSRTSSGSGAFRVDDILVQGTASPVPEPATAAALAGAAILGFAATRRRSVRPTTPAT